MECTQSRFPHGGNIFLEKLQKSCYIQVKKRRVEKEPINSEFSDEIFFMINVFI